MKELNKLIEDWCTQFTPPLRVTGEGFIRDAEDKFVCEVYPSAVAHLIAHALNNLNGDISEKSKDESGTCRLNRDELEVAIDNGLSHAELLGTAPLPNEYKEGYRDGFRDRDNLRCNNLQPKEGEDTKTADSIYSGKDGYQNTLYTADQLFAMATHVAEWAVTNPEKAGPMTMPEWRAHYKEYFLPVFTPFSGEAQLGAWTTEAQKEAAKGRAFIDDITPEAQMRRENK